MTAAVVALIAGAAVAIAVPALAPGDGPPTSASFTAVDFAWNAGAGGSGHTVTIARGGTVDFGYPTGTYAHNVDFDGLAPASCTQTSGPDSGPVPPLPALPTGSGWSGGCSFDTPGRYAFHCDAHPTLMQGTVVVVDPNAPPPPTTETGTTTAPGQPGPPSGGSGGGSSAPARRLRIQVADHQRGSVLRGVLTTPVARSKVVVRALVSNRALKRNPPKRVRKLQVASTTGRSSASGRFAFALTMNDAARRALQRRGHLGVAVRIAVTPPGGRARTAAVAVVLRAPSPANPY